MHLSPVNLKTLAYTLDIEGFDSSRVLQQCGIASIDALRDDGAWLPIDLFDRFMAAAIEVTGDAAFGLVAGKSIALMKHGVLVTLVLPTPSLRQMLDDIGRFALLTVSRAEVRLVESGETARLVVAPLVQGGASGRFRTESVATSTIQMLRLAGANNADILGVDFPYPQPEAHVQRYAANFGPRINFNRRECAIHFNPALLDGKMPAHDPVAYIAARTRAESLLAAMQAGSDLAELVRQRLLRELPRLPSVADSAAHFSMNERMLRRQLGALGTTHADLVQECQRLMAERLLADGQVPLKQIAEMLGFSSVHSFHRAFRRWSGLTPSDWRDGSGAQGKGGKD